MLPREAPGLKMTQEKPKKSRLDRSDQVSRLSEAFMQHQVALKRFIARFLARAQDIEDVAQESFLRAYDAQHTGPPINSPKAFLFRIARNVALNELTRKSRLLTDYIEDSAPSPVLVESSSPEDLAIGHEKLALFCQAAASLPQQSRRAFLMRKVHGLSHKEIAEQLGISVSTVEKHVAAGLLRCSTYLRERGYAMEGEDSTDPKLRAFGGRDP